MGLARGIGVSLMAATLACLARCQDNGSTAGLSIAGVQGKAPIPEYIQEFFLSEAVRSQEKGELQVTFGVDSRQNIGTNAAVQLEYGLTDRLQVSFEMPYGVTSDKDAEIPARWSSTTVGLLYQFIRSDRPFALSAGMGFALPIRSRDHVAYQPTLLVAKTFRKLQIHASFLSDIEQRNSSFEYNVAGVYPLTRRWFPTFEFNGRRLDGKNAFYLTPGLYRHFKHRLETGIGIPVGVGGIAGSLGVVAKMNWELGGEQ